jgi:hypothetical protein
MMLRLGRRRYLHIAGYKTVQDPGPALCVGERVSVRCSMPAVAVM